MAYFLQQLINGLTLGSIYGLIAIGYTMVYGIIGMINFAHGEIYMIGAFIAVTTFLILGLAGVTFVPLALLLVLLVAMLFTSLYGWAVERIAYRPLRGSFRLAPLISAIGMSIFLQNYVQITQGARVKPMPPLIPGGFTIVESNLIELAHREVVELVPVLRLIEADVDSAVRTQQQPVGVGWIDPEGVQIGMHFRAGALERLAAIVGNAQFEAEDIDTLGIGRIDPYLAEIEAARHG